MKRLYTDLQSTVPFVNSDFGDILQNQHMIAYSAYLEGLNDQPYSANGTNRGIILNGIKISAIPNTTKTTHTFNWTLTIDKDALVYFDGQYYSPDPNIIGTTNYTTRRLFIYPTVASASVSTLTQIRPDDRKRKFRNSEISLDGGSSLTLVRPLSQFSEDYIFKIYTDTSTSTFNPTDYPNLPHPGGPQGVPYILLEFGGTSRNLARLLKLNSTDSNDVLISYNPKNWSVNPWSIQNQYKYGYYRDFETSTGQNVFNSFGVGRNELLGFQVWTDIGGKYMVGYDRLSSSSPISGTAFDYNYGVPGNIGGLLSVGLTYGQYAPHIHGNLDPTTTNMDHAHFTIGPIPEHAAEPPLSQNNTSQAEWLNIPGSGNGKMPADATEFEPPFLTRGLPVFTQILNWGNSPGQNAWGNNPPNWDSLTYTASLHKHQIFENSNAGDVPHENRPPYVVALFYSKI